MCKKCAEHVEHVELSYWKTDRIIDLKMDQLEISLDANEEESDIELDSEVYFQTQFLPVLTKFDFSCCMVVRN